MGYQRLKRAVDSFIDSIDGECTQIVSGGADGADSLAEVYHVEKQFLLEPLIFYPDYKTYGKPAVFIRNSQIANACDYLIAFWDGKSTGTLDTIKKAKKLQKPVKIIYY
jgi:hypothetical protein